MQKISFCDNCKKYTLQKTCPTCKKPTRQAKPAKYSPEDKWGEYRRRAKAGETGIPAAALAAAQIDDDDDSDVIPDTDAHSPTEE